MTIVQGRLTGIYGNTKLTKHELLHLLYTYGAMTWREILEYSELGQYAAEKRMQRYFQQAIVDKVGKKGQLVIWDISEKGIERLNFFDQSGCLHAKCSICNYDVEAYLEEIEKAEESEEAEE